MQLSNSSIDMYNSCSMKYYLHYIKKLRSTVVSSPLILGGALDNALNALLLTKKSQLTEEEKEIIKRPPEEIFEEKMGIVDINGEKVNIQISERMDYFNKDFDTDFLTKEDVEKVNNSECCPFILEFSQIKDFKEECQKTIKAGQELSTDLKLTYNYFCWLSLRRKGLYLLDCYKKYIMPRILEVISIQNEVFLPDPDGNYLKGFVDFIAIWEDGKTYVFDNKTASEKYPKNKIETSQQLAIYSEFTQIRDVGYIVMVKKKNKKPEEQIQVLTGKISEELMENVLDTIGNVLYNIKEEKFEQNFNECFKFYKKCQFWDYCRGDTSLKGLVDLCENK